MSHGCLFRYFSKVGIINLPERTDRLNKLRVELARVGLDVDESKVCIPPAPRPADAHGFSSRGVYGNLLSHLSILEDALSQGSESVLILEDDAIFSHSFNSLQAIIVRSLRENNWDQLFIGHSIAKGLPRSDSGLVKYNGEFLWAHCYAVHRRMLPQLIGYIRETIDRPAGDPDGGKMYIDAVFNHFRKRTPELICLLTSPCLSVQRGSPSSLNSPHWYDRNKAASVLSTTAREIRDECWRYGLIGIEPKKLGPTAPIHSAQPWPASAD